MISFQKLERKNLMFTSLFRFRPILDTDTAQSIGLRERDTLFALSTQQAKRPVKTYKYNHMYLE